MKAINRLLILAAIAIVISLSSCSSRSTEYHRAMEQRRAEAAADTIAEADTFTCYTKYIKCVNVAGNKTSVIYDDIDAGYDKQVIMVSGSDAKYLVSMYYGQDVNTNLVIIQSESKCIIKTK